MARTQFLCGISHDLIGLHGVRARRSERRQQENDRNRN
jgi:hypothetical protein